MLPCHSRVKVWGGKQMLGLWLLIHMLGSEGMEGNEGRLFVESDERSRLPLQV